MPVFITMLLRKWCHNNKHFAELAPRRGGHRYGTKKLRHCHPMYWLTSQWRVTSRYASRSHIQQLRGHENTIINTTSVSNGCWWVTEVGVVEVDVVDTCLAAATLSGRGARVYTCTCVRDNTPCRRLPNQADRRIPTHHKPSATMLLKWSVPLNWGRSCIKYTDIDRRKI